LRTIVKLLVKGLGGYGIIVSGNGVIGLDYPGLYTGYPPMLNIKGTLVSIRMPFMERSVGVYEYAEY